MTDFLDISYLREGNSKQQLAYDVLSEFLIIEKLGQFDPILVGTIPINIDLDNSDLDIICFWKDKQRFIEIAIQNFGNLTDFTIREEHETNSVIANFKADNFEVEIFGQNIATQLQNGYRHMIIEYQILENYNEDFRLQIIELKKQGLKTEPAFAKLLKLEGNPYEALLKFELKSNSEQSLKR